MTASIRAIRDLLPVGGTAGARRGDRGRDQIGDRSDLDAPDTPAALVGLMHLAKGLEFRIVLIVGCDEGVLPLASRVECVADEFELDEVIATERQLLYVACTRARERLFISGVVPGSEFLGEPDQTA